MDAFFILSETILAQQKSNIRNAGFTPHIAFEGKGISFIF